MPTKVLLVEDYADAREMYTEYLEHAGYEVLAASDGAQALAQAAAVAPDVVVLDFALPDLNGCEVARRLRAGVKTRGIPLIMFSAHDAVEIGPQAIEAGCDVTLEKPVTPNELVAAIKRVRD
jgi:two-component system, cell cycle response regulator DivK